MRTLAMIGSGPDAWRRIEEELATAGDTDDPASVDRLPYIQACILETGRLFPQVTRTFHAAPTGDDFNGVAVPPGTGVVHLFPFIERDAASDPTSDGFQPERWLGAPHTAPCSNLFRSGAPPCPGHDLILFVIEGAITAHVPGHQRHVVAGSLTDDRLPYTFPRRSIQLIPGTPILPARAAATR